MHSIKEIFKVGYGPSSSHTMGPANACKYILNKYKDIKHIKVTLYGSLASTGKGHLTDYIINLKFKDIPHEVIFDKVTIKEHPNTLVFEIFKIDNSVSIETIYSIGGGSIVTKDSKIEEKEVYPHNSLKEILEYCKDNKLTLSEYIRKYEYDDIEEYIKNIIKVMDDAVIRGISNEGYLPGELHLKRKAPELNRRLIKEKELSKDNIKRIYDLIMIVSAFATAEENASGGKIVTAPTCGSAGVIPGVLAYLKARNTEEIRIIDGLMVAGLIGILCKTNGSISGAEAGCQAEIGVACAMGAAMIAYAKDMNNYKVSESAEIALEHSLGLTCDPVKGYVQIPCIERCAMYALKAKNAYSMVKLIPSTSQVVSFDDSVKTMYKTGKDINCGYKETAEKGLAELIK